MPKTKNTKSSGKTETKQKTSGAKTKKTASKQNTMRKPDENSFLAQLTPYILAAVAVLLGALIPLMYYGLVAMVRYLGRTSKT